jgi:hypothetical protein
VGNYFYKWDIFATFLFSQALIKVKTKQDPGIIV